MLITKEFLEAEIADLVSESERAIAHINRCETAIAVHKMLLKKLDEPEVQPVVSE